MNWKLTIAVSLASAAMVFLAASTTAAPRPRASADAWQLDFTYHPLESIRVKLPGADEPKTYWYLRYDIVNHTGDDRDFQPEIALYTDTGELTKANSFPDLLAVYNAIKQLHNDPLLQQTRAVAGRVLQGEDNGKHGVAIWPDFDEKAGQVDIFFGGLSGESVVVELPVPIKRELRTRDGGTQTIVKTKITLHKTLQLRFKIAGEADARFTNTPELIMSDWVMR